MFFPITLGVPVIPNKNIQSSKETSTVYKPSPEVQNLNNAFLEAVISDRINKDTYAKELFNQYVGISEVFRNFLSDVNIRNIIQQVLPISFPYINKQDNTFIINGLSASLSKMNEVLNRVNFGLLTIVNNLLSSGIRDIKRENLLVYIGHLNNNVFVESVNPPYLYYDPTLYSSDMIDEVLKNHVRFEDKTIKGVEKVFYPIKNNEYGDIHAISVLSTINDYYDKQSILKMMSKDINVKMFFEILFSAAWFGARDSYEVNKDSENGIKYWAYKPNYISYDTSGWNGTHIVSIRIVYMSENNIKNFSLKDIVHSIDSDGILGSGVFDDARKEILQLT